MHSSIKNYEAWNSLGNWAIENQFPFSESIKTSFETISRIDPNLVKEKRILRDTYRSQINAFLGKRSLFCIPSTPCTAPLLSTTREELKQQSYALRTLTLCSIACIGDMPEITVPCGNVNGIPTGLSFIAPHQQDNFLLSALKDILDQIR